MGQYRVRAFRPDGRIIEDRMDGPNEAAVRHIVESRGWLTLTIKPRRPGLSLLDGSALHASVFKERLSLREFLVFNQEFLALVRAGVPVLRIWDLLAERAPIPPFRTVLHGVRENIRGGASISEAMAAYPDHFSALYRASLQSGEQTGNLADVLHRFIAYLKLLIDVREKIRKAMAYPVFLIVVGAAVVAFLLAYVMPTFSEIYAQDSRQLPGPTRLFLSLLDQGWTWLPWISGVCAGLASLTFVCCRTPRGRLWLDGLCVRLPVIGTIFLKSQIIRFARTLATVLAGGIPLVDALRMTGGALTNRVVVRGVERATTRVREGIGLAAALREQGLFPSMTLEMIEVGETTGSLELLLSEVAEFHEGELDLRLSQLMTWIEPALLLIMGALVGAIVILMYLPVFQIAG